jgi:hypothetical protein
MTNTVATPTTQPLTVPMMVPPEPVSGELLELVGVVVGVSEPEKELGGD